MLFRKTKGACLSFPRSSSVDKKRNLESLDEADNPLKKGILLLSSN
jgi:hypothetical protein